MYNYDNQYQLMDLNMKNEKKIIGSVVLATLLALSTTGCGGGSSSDDPAPVVNTGVPTVTPKLAAANLVTAPNKTAALTTYADIALSNYTDALSDASDLVTAVAAFTATPNDTTLAAAKTAWKTARLSYGTTEIFRLSNGPIDSEDAGFMQTWDAPEGQLNAWPLDENMIDATKAADGTTTSGNIIDTAGLFTPSGNGATEVNATTITKAVLSALNENGGDANVATGYHAVEFLLWGQDQDYASFIDDTVTNGATTAGQRDVTDFTTAANADRRKDFLNAAAELIVDDLTKMKDAWTAGAGSYREAFLGGGANAIAQQDALKQIFAGMGTFIKSELANERMAVAILTPSEEDEHSCFSDNTHVDVDKNYRGFVNVLKGEYKGAAVVGGTSLYSLLTQDNKDAIDTLVASIDERMTTMNTAVASEHFDYQIKDGSSNKQNLKYSKNTLRRLGDIMVYVASEYGVSLQESDVTDPDETQI